jgi:hypothetical protein
MKESILKKVSTGRKSLRGMSKDFKEDIIKISHQTLNQIIQPIKDRYYHKMDYRRTIRIIMFLTNNT